MTKDLSKNKEKIYRSLYTAMSEGVAVHELLYDDSGKPVDYVIIDVNPMYEKITHLPREKVIGRKASDLYGAIEPPYISTYAEVASSGKPRRVEFTV